MGVCVCRGAVAPGCCDDTPALCTLMHVVKRVRRLMGIVTTGVALVWGGAHESACVLLSGARTAARRMRQPL